MLAGCVSQHLVQGRDVFSHNLHEHDMLLVFTLFSGLTTTYVPLAYRVYPILLHLLASYKLPSSC